MKGEVRIIIADDEPAGRRTLQMLLGEDPESSIVAMCRSAAETTDAVLRHRPDVLFLDVEMPGGTGFDALRGLPADLMPVVVFVTAFDEYAVEAFGVQATDYLLKPFSDSRFRMALARAKERLWQRTAAAAERNASHLARINGHHARAAATHSPGDRLAIRTPRGTRFVSLDEIDWIEARGDYVRIYSGERFQLVRGAIGWYEERLDPSRFVRVHRSAIVNVSRVVELKRGSTGDAEAVMQDGRRCRVSQSGRERLGRVFGRRL
jgi:two-component system LytT family response regulator